jgi:hypothetical protein
MMLAASLTAVFGLLAAPATVITFDSGQPGLPPAGWTFTATNSGVRPKWEILKDPTAPTQPFVLAQTSKGPSSNRAPLAILNGIVLRDGDISVRLKPVSGRQDQVGGIVFRYRDENNYYMAQANAVADEVALYKVENGKRTPLIPEFAIDRANDAARKDIACDVWIILKVSVRAGRFQIFLNHRRLLRAEDKTFAAPGKVGLVTLGDSVTYFDDLRIYPR